MSTNRYLFALCLLGWPLLSGCDSTQPQASETAPDRGKSEQLTSVSSSADRILQRLFQTYQNLESYEDRAVVELRYKYDGQLSIDQAPMSVAWDRQGKMGLNVYSLQAGPARNSNRWHLRLGQRYPEIENQVLSRSRPEKVSFQWLFSEPIVGQELSAGLAGFPVALDLLLNPHPLAGLLDSAAPMEVHPAQSNSGRAYWLIQLVNKQLTYGFWIDQETHLLRRVDLPTDILPEEILSDRKVSEIELSIDFQEVRINQPIEWDTFRVELQPNDLLVSRFVAKPAEMDLRGFNQVVPAFRLQGPDGQVFFDSTPTGHRKASVLLWLADHPACLAASEQLAAVEATLRASGVSQQQVEFVSIWAEPEPPPGMTFEQLRKHWKMPGKFVMDPGAAGRDLFHVQEAPTVVLMDGQGKLHLRDVRVNPLLDQALPPLIFRLLGGTNVAEEMIRAHGSREQRYAAELALAAALDRQENHPKLPEAYPPALSHLQPVAKQSFPSKITRLVQDNLELPWVLTADGSLTQLDGSLKALQEIQTRWTHKNPADAMIKPSPDGSFFAKAGKSESRIEIIEVRSGQSLQFQLPPSAHPTALHWLKAPKSKVPRLAVLTDNRQIILLDPENREQLSGSCSDAAVAIIGDSLAAEGQSGFSSRVILASGRVDSIDIPSSDKISSRDNNHTVTRPAVHFAFSSSETESVGKQYLGFVPTNGPWMQQSKRGEPSVNKDHSLLAVGWQAAGEPAVFFLDPSLNLQWHYRLPASASDDFCLQAACATSPVNGQTLWAVLDRQGVVHLLHDAAQWSDHFRPEKQPVGISLITAGDQLLLLLACRDEITAYRID